MINKEFKTYVNLVIKRLRKEQNHSITTDYIQNDENYVAPKGIKIGIKNEI
jgi:hypothetical protein